MPITILEDRGFFQIQTAHTEYQMAVDRLGTLRHLWYGERVDTNMAYLLVYPDIGFSGNPYEAENDRTYSLDTLPQEYGCEGTGDFRITALAIRCMEGVRGVRLRYEGYQVKKGKYAIPGLPASYGNDAEAETLEITLRDQALGLIVTLRYGVFPDFDIITRNVSFYHQGEGTIAMEKAASLCLDLPRRDWEWVHFHGRHTLERLPERTALIHGVQESSSLRGTSSHQQNPTVLLCTPDCTETRGDCIGAMLMYSGSFQTQVELDQIGQSRLIMGIHPDLFRWALEPDGRFDSPEVVMSYSSEGFETLSHRFHAFIRNHICRGKYKLAPRGVLVNNWEATFFDFNEDKLCELAKVASELGIEMLVLDDGWFGKRDSDLSGLGDWNVNFKKLPHGLNGLSQRLKQFNMKLGLWLEPEMVSEDSELYHAHPDWALQIPGRFPIRGRYQLVLDMSRQEVQDFLFETISDILNHADIAYVKWDMNRSINDWFSAALPPARMGEAPHRYMLGLYSLLERLTSAFPDILFEGCSGGGGRFDAGMLHYFSQIWCSDDTDAYQRTLIQYGTSFFYPVSAVGSHVSAVPNQQTGRITPLETRAVVAMAGSFGYELDLTLMSDEEKQAVKEQVARYKAYQPLIHNGKYYRLSDPLHEDWAGWEFVADDHSRALIQGVVFRSQPNALRRIFRPRGLDPKKLYKITGIDAEREKNVESYTGAALMQGGILLLVVWGDYCPVTIEIIEIC